MVARCERPRHLSEQADAVPLMTDDHQRAPARAPRVHEVKSWTMLFEAALSGRKTHDIRVLDRDYQVGDCLLLQEYDWGSKKYTGRELLVHITYITCARRGDPHARACAFSPTCLHPDYGVLSICKVLAS